MVFNEELIPAGIGEFGESLVYEHAYRLEDGTIVRKKDIITEHKQEMDYKVYEIVDGQVHTLALCPKYSIADAIARSLAKNDPNGDSYFFGSAHADGFVEGGGWYEEYYMQDSKLKHRSLE
jgi:hypothetical protein